MDDKFLRDKINDDNIEIPESLLPENISKLLEKSEEKVNGLAGESDIDGRAKGTNENIVNIKGINEKTVNESDKKNREKRQMIKYLRSCALAAAALIVVLTGASMMGRLRENKYTAAGQNGNPVPGTDMPETMEETFVCGTTQAAGDTDMNKTKYDELYDKLVRGNAYNITTDGGYYITDDVRLRTVSHPHRLMAFIMKLRQRMAGGMPARRILTHRMMKVRKMKKQEIIFPGIMTRRKEYPRAIFLAQMVNICIY